VANGWQGVYANVVLVVENEEITMPDTVHDGPIDRFLSAIEGGMMAGFDAFSPGVTLDATVPNWRFSVQGDGAVRDELERWFADQGTFEELRRTELPTGEWIEFTLRWEEQGVPHACHQAHVVEVTDGCITRDKVWCGGRWEAALMAEMAEADSGSG
jgi:hypothetical protein